MTELAPQRRLLIAGGLWMAASQLLPAVGTAVLSVVAARVLGSDALGRQSLIAYVNMAVAAVVLSSLGNATLQQLGFLRGAGDLAGVAALGAWFRRTAFGIGVLLGVLMAGIGLLTGQDRLAWLIIGIVALADAAGDGIAARMVVEEGFTPVSRLRLAFQVLGPPLGIAAVAVGLGIPGIFAGDGLAALGLWLALGRRQRRRRSTGAPAGGREPRRLRPPVALSRTYALFALNEAVTQIVARRVEFVVLAALSTPREIAMYSVAFIIVGLAAVIPSAVAAAALPVVAAADGAGNLATASGHLHLAVRIGTLLCLPLTALVFALGPTLVLLVYGPEFADAARLVPLASLALLLPVLIAMCTQWWSGRGRLGVVLVTGGIAAAVDIVVALALSAELGALGAVLAKLGGTATLAGGLLLVTTRRTGAFGWHPRGLLLMAATSLAGGGLARVTVEFPGVQGPGQFGLLVVGGLVGTVVIGFGCILGKVLETEEYAWIRPLLPARLQPVLGWVTRRRASNAGDASG